MIAHRNPTGDLDTATGLTRRITGREYAAQKIRQKLLFIRSEWILDTRLGVPWFEEILVKNPDLRLVQARIRDVILSVPGISSVQQTETRLDGPARKLHLAYVATYRDDSGPATISDLVTSAVI
jgi:hypothetical protein